MELEQLELLEKKIEQAVRLIEQLKLENLDLTNEINALRNESQSKDALIQQLKEENENLKQMQRDSVFGKEKQERIKSKVEQMLTRLDELQYDL